LAYTLKDDDDDDKQVTEFFQDVVQWRLFVVTVVETSVSVTIKISKVAPVFN
jgi:hypothetical protein